LLKVSLSLFYHKIHARFVSALEESCGLKAASLMAAGYDQMEHSSLLMELHQKAQVNLQFQKKSQFPKKKKKQ